ncbi:type VI secretion system baseplate subunit TssK [Roseateles terrae]|uniref:Type VI secretion system protein ImpJ n=1 Tax=Roseateles terrae TaxID=431060 RepID=A0ABR6GMH5_9BURK|nr:type VI secretion system baseplate subunit TssK [Roseateles terrae]MBB3193255.1 type VI secretion system protein ImpJ [Roseateles terrae]OWQ89534.1 type VI secretion system-associated protein [Roseateles terrae]
MSWHSKVIWSQGMFLLPHHFQQETRYLEHLVDSRVRSLATHGWGFTSLELDEALLAVGRLGLIRARGVLPDGTPFHITQTDPAPPPLDVPSALKDEIIYLAAPIARPGTNQVAFSTEGQNGNGIGNSQGGGNERNDALDLMRYRVLDLDVRDATNVGDEPEAVQTGSLALRLLPARELNDGYAAIGVARVAERRADQQVILDTSYVPPQTRLDATQHLAAMASLLHGLVRQRAQLLASRMGQLNTGVSELADFLMLQALNRADPLFRQHAGSPHQHPEALHRDCLQLAGDLATFVSENRLASDYPLYRHDDLRGSFAPLLEDLRRMLSVVLERNALQIDLVDRTHGVRTAVVGDPDLLRSASFVLAVNAQVGAEQLRQRFPAQSKLGPVDKIRDLVNLQLPGIALRALPVAPRQLPFHAGFHYFELDRGGELWKQLERSGSMALHVAGDFPGLELELWAIRQ